MSSPIRALVLVMFVASCGGTEGTAPQNLENACAILDERPHYTRALTRTERRWGVPVSVQMATIHQESKFVGNARTPLKFALGIIPMGRQSSAYGYSQALDGTWDEYKAKTGRRRARRDDIDDATDFMGWYMTLSEQRNGIPKTDARRQYLAYHEGHAGYRRGSYNSKTWLVRVASRVDQRSQMYANQLRSCGKW